MKTALRYLLYVLLALFVTAAIAIILIVKLVLAPAKDEWAERVSYGPIGFDVGVPTVLRLATASWFAPQLAGHKVDTRFGSLRFDWNEAAGLEVNCEKCSVLVPDLGDQPVQVRRLTFTARRDVDSLFGTLRAVQDDVPAGNELRGRWSGRLTQKDLQLSAEVDDAPIGQWYQLLVPELPELRRARIGGTASLQLQAALPEGAFSLRPRLVLFTVDGLGAEGLLESRAGSCGAPAKLANEAWLSRGVVAALDADFFQHPGYESASLARGRASSMPTLAPVATANAKPRRVSSTGIVAPTPPPPTLNVQVARRLLPPLPYPAAQQLRDMLYAVEFERAPGKQRLLQAYLDMAPWGEQICGAEAAARRYFKRSARSLEPTQALWMATLLRNPDAMLQKWRDDGQIDRAVARKVAEQVHEITAGQRAALFRGAATARFVAPPAP
ncbi:MAG: transglycosylase domain-containing protein [Proteobacteria bacterium]|nr:transglycosylase domain-containing protein [Pseudomonadota bacterium]